MSQDIANKYPSHAIIFDYLVSKRTGILVFEPGNRKLFFESGQLVFASSEMAGEHFADILVTSSILSKDQLEKAKAASKPGKSLGHQLKALGFATSQQLAHALKQQITYIVDRAIAQVEGDCQSQEGPLPNKLPKLKIQTLGLIIKSVFKMDAEIFQFPVQLDQALFKTAVGDLHLSKIAIPPSYLELFNFLRENVMFSPGTLQEIAKLDGSQLKKMIYILHQLGIIAFKDEVAAIQEPLADLTNDEDTFQDDTMGEDALATVLPPTTPPKTDLQGHLDPQRAARAINLPAFAQGGASKEGTPTLRVQDPRAGMPMELDETVRQYDPLKFGAGRAGFDDENRFEAGDDLGIERDLSTISRELDPEELEPLPDSIEEIEDDLPSLQTRQELLFSDEDDGFDSEEDNSFDTNEQDLDPAETGPQPLLDSFDPIDALSTDTADMGTKKLFLEPSDPIGGEDYLDTEPALPIHDLRNSLHVSPTQPASTPQTTKQDDPTLSANDTTKRVIMPLAEEDPYFLDGKPPSKKRFSIKLILGVLLVGVLGLVGFRLYENYRISTLTDEYLGNEVASAQNGENSSDDLDTSGSSQTAQAENVETPDDAGLTDPNQTSEAVTMDEESGSTLGTSEPESDLTLPEKEAPATPSKATTGTDRAATTSTEPQPKPVERTEDAIQPSDPTRNPYAGSRFADELNSSRTRFLAAGATHTLVIMVACQEETVIEDLKKYQGEDLFLFPRQVHGQDCWMLTWGAFGSYREAASQIQNFPPALRQGDVWTVRPDL